MPATRSRIVATPRARAAARARGVNLEAVRGSGPHGRIVERDVRQLDHEAPSRAGRTNASHLEARLLSQAAPVPVMSVRCEADVTDVVEAGLAPADSVAWTRRSVMALAAAGERWTPSPADAATIGLLLATGEGLLGLHLGTLSEVARELAPDEISRHLDSARRLRVPVAHLAPTDYLFHHVGAWGVDIASQGLLESVGLLLSQGCVEQRPAVVDGALAARWRTTLVATFDLRRFGVEHASRVLTTTCDLVGES